MTALDAIAAMLIVDGGAGAYRAYKRSLSSLESLGEAAVEPHARVRGEAPPDVDELSAVAARLEAGERLTPAEHAHVASLVRELGRLRT